MRLLFYLTLLVLPLTVLALPTEWSAHNDNGACKMGQRIYRSNSNIPPPLEIYFLHVKWVPKQFEEEALKSGLKLNETLLMAFSSGNSFIPNSELHIKAENLLLQLAYKREGEFGIYYLSPRETQQVIEHLSLGESVSLEFEEEKGKRQTVATAKNGFDVAHAMFRECIRVMPHNQPLN